MSIIAHHDTRVMEAAKRAAKKKNEIEAENERRILRRKSHSVFFCFSPILYVAQERN